MKTPEELAEEFSKVNAETDVGALGCYRQGLYEGFLAGYQAAASQWISVGDRIIAWTQIEHPKLSEK
jgi:hypothetical protein